MIPAVVSDFVTFSGRSFEYIGIGYDTLSQNKECGLDPPRFEHIEEARSQGGAGAVIESEGDIRSLDVAGVVGEALLPGCGRLACGRGLHGWRRCALRSKLRRSGRARGLDFRCGSQGWCRRRILCVGKFEGCSDDDERQGRAKNPRVVFHANNAVITPSIAQSALKSHQVF